MMMRYQFLSKQEEKLLYDVFEAYRRVGRRYVTLQELGLEDYGLSLEELYQMLKTIERKFVENMGKLVIHIALPFFRGKNYPIPIRFFYNPKTLEPLEVK